MRATLSLACLLACSSALAADVRRAAPPGDDCGCVFEIRKGLAQPESVYYDYGTGALYVSNVAGSPAGKDGKGWILKAGLDGAVLDPQWAKGLDAPKGMRAAGGTLHVADIDRLVSIDLETGEIVRRVEIEGAKMLNDVAVGPEGEVYVSDTFASAIFKVDAKGRVETVARGDLLESPNGLLWRDGGLVVAAWGRAQPDWSTKSLGRLYRLDPETGVSSFLTPEPTGHLDGVEALSDGSFLATDWMAGKLFKIPAGGGDAVLLMEGFKGSADLGVVLEKGLVLVPRMLEDAVTVYRLAEIEGKE